MKRRAGVSLPKLFGFAFAVLFGFLFLNVLFNREVYHPNTVFMAIFVVLAILGLIVCYRRLSESSKVSDRFGTVLAVMAAVLFLVEIFFGFFLRYDPQWDLEAIYKGAIHWVETGTFADYFSSTCHQNYFILFPNNLGSLCFFYGLFRVAGWLHLTDYFAVAMVINALLITGTMVLSANIAKRLWSPSAGIFCAALFLISPPFWFLAPVFYTDALSMIFPVAAWYCALRGDGCRRLGRVLWYVGAGLCGGIGGLLKPTVWIVLIALAIGYALRRQWKALLTFVLASLILVGATQLAMHQWIYPTYLDSETAQADKIPTEYWLAVGLSGNGTYRQDYFQIAWENEGQPAKKAALREVINANLKDEGVGGLLKLMNQKLTRAFGDGTYASSDFLDDNPTSSNFLHTFLLYDSPHYSAYTTVCTAIWAALLLLTAAATLKMHDDIPALTAPIALTGLLLFFSVWEANGRYMVNYIPMIFLTATGGMVMWSPNIKRRQKKR